MTGEIGVPFFRALVLSARALRGHALAVLLLAFPSWCQAKFSFGVTSDQRFFAGDGQFDGTAYYRGTLEVLRAHGVGDFMINVGDLDPVADTAWTISRVFGEDFPWIPVVGNHELPGSGFETSSGENMRLIREQSSRLAADQALTGHRPGPSGCPETTYSFDFQNVHFVVLNEYCDAGGDSVTDGDVTDHLHDWLAADLAASRQQHVFVFGHEPAYPLPDMDNGRLRHEGDSLDAHPAHRDRFWRLLRDHGVTSYFCGHTHNTSVQWIDGIWQLDSGHARGLGDPGAPSSFLLIEVDGPEVIWNVYRDVHDGNSDYDDLRHEGGLRARPMPWLELLLDG